MSFKEVFFIKENSHGFFESHFQEEKSHIFINSFFKGKIYGLGKFFSMKIPWVFETEFSIGKPNF